MQLNISHFYIDVFREDNKNVTNIHPDITNDVRNKLFVVPFKNKQDKQTYSILRIFIFNPAKGTSVFKFS